MSACEAVFTETSTTACNNMERRFWLETKGEVRCLGEVTQREIFTRSEYVIQISDISVKNISR